MAPKLPKPPPPKAPAEALAWFAARVPFTRDERDKLAEEAKKRAFFVSNVAQLRLVSDVHKAITKAVAKGTTLQDFKASMGDKLAAAWGEERPAVVETIFRTNVQAAYNAGRLEQFEDPLVKRFRPMRGWAVILDGRTTEFICRPLATVVVPAGSAFASSHIPPLHMNCRTGLMALSEEDARADYGGRTETHVLPDVEPQEGFGGDPRALPRPDLSDVDPALRRIFVHRAEGQDES